MLPRTLATALEQHLLRVRTLHDNDLEAGYGEVWLPDALAVKYPSANRAWSWQWIFPSAKRSTDPRGGSVRRSYCRHAVKEIWEGRKQLHVGEHDLVPEEDPAQARGALFIA